MASTYALPIAPTTHAHGHGRSQSQPQYFTAPSPNRSSKALSPVNEGVNPTSGHQHRRSDMSGQLYGAVRSPYAEYNSNAQTHNHGHGHSNSHAHTNSNGSTHSLTTFANGRANGRMGLDSPQTPRKNAAAAKYGMFSPVQESAPVPPPSYGAFNAAKDYTLTHQQITLQPPRSTHRTARPSPVPPRLDSISKCRKKVAHDTL